MSRSCNPHQCHKCGAHIRSGLDGDALAFVARVDDEPLTRQGELLAILNGRKTYSLEGQRLYRRDLHHIKKAAEVVHATHRCWEPMPVGWTKPPAPTNHVPENPPF